MMLSVAIPTYEAAGKCLYFLDKQFNLFRSQTFKDFEIVISDHSRGKEIEDFCKRVSDLNVKYVKNTENIGSCSSNTNNAIRHSSGSIIKIIFQDDFLWSAQSLEIIVKSFDASTDWMINACQHTSDDGVTFNREFYPYYNHKIHLGFNTLSCPSSLTIRNREDKISFDERLNWLMDVDYYKRLYEKFGSPKILNEIVTVNRIWGNQLTNSVSEETKNKELSLMIRKFGQQ